MRGEFMFPPGLVTEESCTCLGSTHFLDATLRILYKYIKKMRCTWSDRFNKVLIDEPCNVEATICLLSCVYDKTYGLLLIRHERGVSRISSVSLSSGISGLDVSELKGMILGN